MSDDDEQRAAIREFLAPQSDPIPPDVKAAQDQWEAARIRNENGTGRDPSLGFYLSIEDKRADQEHDAKIVADYARIEEAKTEREKLKRGYGPKEAGAPRQLVGRELGSVQMHAIEWLWTGWIPKGYITLLAGETGAGKSTVFCDVAARVTTGAPWPGEYDCPNTWRKPERVLWLGSEDSIEEMTVPRLGVTDDNAALAGGQFAADIEVSKALAKKG